MKSGGAHVSTSCYLKRERESERNRQRYSKTIVSLEIHIYYIYVVKKPTGELEAIKDIVKERYMGERGIER